MFQEIRGTLEAEGFKYEVQHQEEDRQILKAGFNCPNGNVVTWIDMRPSEEAFIINVHCPIHVDSKKEVEVLKLLNGLNARTYLGHWEYEAENGMIKLRAAQAAGGPFPVHGPTFMNIYSSVIESMDTAIPAIAGVGFASMQADNALHRMMHGIDPSMN